MIISFDRLTRFKYTEDKYLRVFKDIILSNLVLPKFKRKDLDLMDYNSLKSFAVNVINTSLNEICSPIKNDLVINKKILEYENQIFNLSEDVNILLDKEINYLQVIQLINDKSVQNLQWLKSLESSYNSSNGTFKYPIRKLIITEGITEEILLPVFAKICDFDFDKYGIQVISAGGKNQVVKLFYAFAELSKLPIFVLLDSDAKSNYNQILPKLRKIDKIHILKSGEIDDILPKNLILRTLNDYFVNLNSIDDTEFEDSRMVKNLEEIFKKKGFHEFKKSEFANLIKSHIKSKDDISAEVKMIIDELSSGLL